MMGKKVAEALHLSGSAKVFETPTDSSMSELDRMRPICMGAELTLKSKGDPNVTEPRRNFETLVKTHSFSR